MTIAWNPSTDNVGVSSYTAWAQGVSPVQSVSHPQTSATWTSLQPGTTYTFRVQAFDARYNGSAPSSPLTVTTVADATAPAAPSGLSLADTVHGQPVDGVTASTVLLRWTRGTDQHGLVMHEVLVNGGPNPDVFSTPPAGTFPRPSIETAWVRQLTPGTSYEFAVRARDAAGYVSGLSNAVTVHTNWGAGC